jgi:hypothetical protein
MKSEVNEDFKRLVYVRLQALPDGTEISIGGGESLTKNELLEHVARGDEIGLKMVEVEREFFQMLKDGSLYDWVSD